jgi:hypothetical protein
MNASTRLLKSSSNAWRLHQVYLRRTLPTRQRADSATIIPSSFRGWDKPQRWMKTITFTVVIRRHARRKLKVAILLREVTVALQISRDSTILHGEINHWLNGHAHSRNDIGARVILTARLVAGGA